MATATSPTPTPTSGPAAGPTATGATGTSTSRSSGWGTRDLLRQSVAGLRVLIGLTVLGGILYPALILLIGLAVPGRADGSMVSYHGKVVGSSLIGQNAAGKQWFHPRPSAAGKDGYDPTASGASNLGPTNTDLLKAVKQRRAAVAAEDGVSPSAVPADAITASASGLDPDISPAYAAIQVDRVAAATGLSTATVRHLVAEHTSGRTLGFIGEPTVNVLELNLALAARTGAS